MAEESGFDKDEAIFLSIMYSFHAAAMQHMGKIANPFTGKVERDLDAARGTIDVLLMFQKKTEGNLSDRERRALTTLITELQLNYVDEAKREPAAAEPEEAAPEETAPAEDAAESAEATPPAEEPAAEKPSAGAEAKEAEAGEDEKKPAEKKAAKKGRGRKKKEEE
jgi:uncharacterized membrane protein